MIYNLAEASNKNIHEIGGKAASLAKMLAAGFHIPSGFVISADSYNGMSDELQKQILEAFAALGSEYVAVRSSAIAEDGHDAAWAGQLDTFLNVTESSLIESIKKCWESLHSDRAQAYASQHEVDISTQKVAVIVQAMVQSEIAGVAFSVHPVTHDDNTVVIEAAFGLGEAVVSGEVSPDTYTVSKSDFTISDRHIGMQQKKLVLDAGINTWAELGPDGATQKMTDDLILRLAREVQKIEAFYEFPVDIEWAFVDNELYITQSRPITTLHSKEKSEQHMPLYEPQQTIFRWGPIPGRWYYIGDFVDAVFHHFKDVYTAQQPPQTQVLFNNNQVLWLTNDADFRSFGKNVFSELVRHPEIHTDFKMYWLNALKQAEALGREIESYEIASYEDMQTYARKLYDGMIAFWMPTLPGEFANYGSDTLLRQELSKYITDERELGKAMQVLTAPTELSFMQKIEIELLKATDLEAFAQRYSWLANGYGGVEKLDSAYFEKEKSQLNPSLIENIQKLFDETHKNKQTYIKTYAIPDYVVTICNLIIELILQQDKRKEMMMQLQSAKEVFLEKVAAFTETDSNELRNISLRELSTLVDEQDLTDLIRDRFESLYGFVCNSGNVMQLPAEKSQHYWERYSRDEIDDEVHSFSGVIASRGPAPRTTGKVSIILDPLAVNNFADGDILVTTMTSPEYIDIMRRSSGVITDTGGLTSHAAILARELNIPCIVGTRIASGLLANGDMVELDTHAGIVRKLNS